MNNVLTNKVKKAYIMSLFNNPSTPTHVSIASSTMNGTVGATTADSSKDGAKEGGTTLADVSLPAIFKKATAHKGGAPK